MGSEFYLYIFFVGISTPLLGFNVIVFLSFDTVLFFIIAFFPSLLTHSYTKK